MFSLLVDLGTGARMHNFSDPLLVLFKFVLCKTLVFKDSGSFCHEITA